MRTPRLPVVEWTDTPADLADLNGLVRFAERRNLVSARVPSHFKRSLLTAFPLQQWFTRTRLNVTLHVCTLHVLFNMLQNVVLLLSGHAIIFI